MWLLRPRQFNKACLFAAFSFVVRFIIFFYFTSFCFSLFSLLLRTVVLAVVHNKCQKIFIFFCFLLFALLYTLHIRIRLRKCPEPKKSIFLCQAEKQTCRSGRKRDHHITEHLQCLNAKKWKQVPNSNCLQHFHIQKYNIIIY